MCLYQRGDIPMLNGGPLKVVERLTCLGSSVPSTENDINTHLRKAWTATDILSVIWKSDLSNEVKRIFPSSGSINTAIWMQHLDTNLTYVEIAWRQLYKNAASYTEVQEATFHETTAVRQPPNHHENHKN